MSDITQRLEVILTSFSSDKCNDRFKFKLKPRLHEQFLCDNFYVNFHLLV